MIESAPRSVVCLARAAGRAQTALAIVLVGVAAALASCGGSRPSASDTARRLALTLEVGREEHSKDSHERRAVLELRDGVLTARRRWSGYWGRWDPPATPETIRVDLGDPAAGGFGAVEGRAVNRRIRTTGGGHP